VLSNQLSRLGSELSTAAVVRFDGVEFDETGAESAPRRTRVDTDGSFKTANEPAPPVMVKVARRRCKSLDVRSDRINADDPREAPATLSSKSSFLRIHDLAIDESKVKSQSSNRPDLYSLGNDDSHHVINSLMKLAFECVTDEGDRWTPDRSTEKALPKRPESERKWLYATGDDIFAWCGMFDTGYKEEIPVFKARAVIQATAREVLDLLFDSSRVKQYNKLSLGREDKHVIKKGFDTNDGKIHGEPRL